MERVEFLDKIYKSNAEYREEIFSRWLELFIVTKEQSWECEKRGLDELNGRNLGELESYMNKENIKKIIGG